MISIFGIAAKSAAQQLVSEERPAADDDALHRTRDYIARWSMVHGLRSMVDGRSWSVVDLVDGRVID